MILTGFATVDTAVAALHEGVDDYLVKPAQPQAVREAVQRALGRCQAIQQKAVLLSRMAADMRTLLGNAEPGSPPASAGAAAAVRRIGPLALDEAAHRATWHGRLLALTPTEFKLLAHLAHHADVVQSAQELVTAVQGYDCSAQEARELIKPHLYRLRAVLESDVANPHYLINVRGVGYMLKLRNR